MNIVFATGTSLGAPIGGIMADVWGWRWSFGIQIPLIFISTLIVAFRLHLPNRQVSEEPMRQKLKRIDFWGALLLVCPGLDDVDLDILCIDFDTWVESWGK